MNIESCPKCSKSVHLKRKLLLIDAFNEKHFAVFPNERAECPCEGDMSVDGLLPGVVQAHPLQQFIVGLYCDSCGVGFVPESMAKPAPQKWKLSKRGWHRVNEDGTLGPPQNRIQRRINISKLVCKSNHLANWQSLMLCYK